MGFHKEIIKDGVIIKNPIGNSGLSISAIALGAGTFGREINEDASWKILDYATEKGITFHDNAESYGGGNNYQKRQSDYGTTDVREVTTEMYSGEKILSRWMKSRGCRDEITICTKVSSGNSAGNIKKQMLASLDRLEVDCVDVYMLHSPDENVPIEETMDALNEEIDAGRTKVIGCSNFSGFQLREALDVSTKKGYARFEISEPRYNLADRLAEIDHFPICRKEGITVMPYSPLAAGFLTGKYVSDRSKFPKGARFDISPGHADIYFTDRNFQIVKHLRDKSLETSVPMVRLAMAWAMSHPDVTATLIGARTTAHIDNALQAAEMTFDLTLREEMNNWD